MAPPAGAASPAHLDDPEQLAFELLEARHGGDEVEEADVLIRLTASPDPVRAPLSFEERFGLALLDEVLDHPLGS